MTANPKQKSDLDRLRLAVSPGEAARISGVGRTTLYEAIGSCSLRSLKIGKRRLITIEALQSWLAEAERSSVRPADAR